MRVKKRFLSAVLLTAMVCASFSGCGDGGNTSEITETVLSVAQIESATDTSEQEKSSFCFDGVNQISFGNTTLSLPFSENELKEDYYVSNPIGENGTIIEQYHCIYKGNKELFLVEYNEDGLIDSISTLSYAEYDDINWSIIGLKCNLNEDEIVKKLGEPTRYTENKSDNSAMLSIEVQNGIITKIFITNNIFK